MNIFALHDDPQVAARQHCDKHVLKMVIEYAQLLSTAHRTLDGKQTVVRWSQPIFQTRSSGYGLTQLTHEIIGHRERQRKVLLLDGESAEMVEQYVRGDDGQVVNVLFRLNIKRRRMMHATHGNHPSAVWARETSANYKWLLELWVALMGEYTRRYGGKTHASAAYLTNLSALPKNIPVGLRTPFPQAMPVEFKVPNDSIAAYHNFYLGSKSRFARWTNTEAPAWFVDGITIKEGAYDASRFQRSR